MTAFVNSAHTAAAIAKFHMQECEMHFTCLACFIHHDNDQLNSVNQLQVLQQKFILLLPKQVYTIFWLKSPMEDQMHFPIHYLQ